MGKHHAPPGQQRSGLSLERFAHAKTSTYDKKQKKEKEFALNAKKVNKYRKLKQRLLKAGKLQPHMRIPEEDAPEEVDRPTKRSRASGGGNEMDRILARAGPPPEEGSDDEAAGRDDMVGEESEYASEEEIAGQRDVGPASVAHPPAHAMQRSRGSTGKGKQDVSIPGQHCGTGKELHAEGVRGDGAHFKGKQQRVKPMSRMQRIAANVQAQKEEEMRAKEQRRRDIEAHKARVAEVEKQRKQQTKLMRKRTRQGQPVMKFRVDKILSQLEAEMNAKP